MSAEQGSEPSVGLRDRLVAQAASLPLGNQPALMHVASLCDDEDAGAREVALAVAGDEGLAALLLRLANSAHSASRARIADLTTAVARLGFALVQSLAVSAPGLRLLRGPMDDLHLARRELHRHAVRTGLAARALAPSDSEAERALAAGLLHNLGLYVLSVYAADEFRQLLDAASRGHSLPPVELETLGFTHAELGAVLAEQWGYPPSLVVAIRDHDAPGHSSRLAALVQVADLVVRKAGIGVEPAVSVPRAALTAAAVTPASLGPRLIPLLEAQDRVDRRLEEEFGGGEAPAGPPARDFIEILDQLF